MCLELATATIAGDGAKPGIAKRRTPARQRLPERGAQLTDLRLRVVASTGLVIGAVLGMAGTFAPSASLRGLAWGIDGTALIVSAALLTFITSAAERSRGRGISRLCHRRDADCLRCRRDAGGEHSVIRRRSGTLGRGTRSSSARRARCRCWFVPQDSSAGRCSR